MGQYVESFKHYKKSAITAAKELCYKKEIVDKIRAAKTETEITNILKGARENNG